MPRWPCAGGGWALAWAFLTVASLSSQAGAIEAERVAVVDIQYPPSLQGTYPGLFSTFSSLPESDGTLAAWTPPADDPVGCTEYQLPAALLSGYVVAVVRRGNCTFVRKALLAQRAGAKAIIVVSDSDYLQEMGGGNETHGVTEALEEGGMITVGIAKSLGDKVINWCQDHGVTGDSPDPVLISLELYSKGWWDPAEFLIVCLGTTLVAAGAYFSTSDMSEKGTFQQAVAAPQEEVMEVDTAAAFGFFFFGSCFLVILYFFMKYMIYFIIFMFCLGGVNTLTQIGSIFLQWVTPGSKQKAGTLPLVGPIAYSDVAAVFPAALVVVCWLIGRNGPYGWITQDIIGAGFLCWLQRTIRLPDIRIATVLLSIMFFFDIFWVFISPLLFQGHSVMVTVATGGGTGEAVPMLLKIPPIGDPLGGARMLGFGDIALPGLLVSYLRRHDAMSKRGVCGGGGYFVPALIGYFFGLCTTIVALMLMKKGQPALLYLVPGTLGTTVLLALCRGELQNLWDGRPCGSRGRGAGGHSARGDASHLTSPEDGQSDSPSTCCSGNDGL